MKPSRPLLRPHHFAAESLLRFTDAGLCFSTVVGDGDREFECVVSGMAEEHLQRLLQRSQNRVGRVVLNPRRPSLKRLAERLRMLFTNRCTARWSGLEVLRGG